MYDLIKRQFYQQLRESKPCQEEPCNSEPNDAFSILEPQYCIIDVQLWRKIKPKVSAIVELVAIYIIATFLIVYGSIHINDCPAERMVAVSVIVLGSVTLISRLANSPYDFREARGFVNVRKNFAILCFNAVLQIVIIFWYFALCYHIFSMKPDTEPEKQDTSNYCALDFYRCVFWGSIIGLVYFGVKFIWASWELVFLLEK